MTQPQNTLIVSLLIFLLIDINVTGQDWQHFNYELPAAERVDFLLKNMTLEEKVSQLTHDAAGIERLGIPEYNWWNECLHGVARAGYATVFPQSITVAASFDRDLMHQIGNITSTEARAKHHHFVRQGKREIYQGLTFWSPNINIFRDPRWGRGHETYGEDPYLTGEMATEFIKGLQGTDPNYFKVIATSKHYAVHSGPEPLRHSFDVDVSDVDLFETYLPAFRKTVTEGGVYSLMGAYNRFRGESCSAHSYLMGDILRGKWEFEGYMVSDCWALADIYNGHNIVETPEEAAALAIKRGMDLNCGVTYKTLAGAVEKGLVTEQEIDLVLRRLLIAKIKLGLFDPEEMNPYSTIPYRAIRSDFHKQVALEAAQKSMVLLKNDGEMLPLSNEIGKIAVIGPNADNWEALIGNYNGIPFDPVTVLEGIRAKVEPETEVVYAEGSDLAEGVHNLRPIPSVYFETEDGRQGLTGEYFANSTLEGEPVFTKTDPNIDFYWEQDSPDPRMKDNEYAVRWTGYLVPKASGTYQIGTWAMSKSRLFIDDELYFDSNATHHAFYREKPMELKAGQKYRIRYEYMNLIGDGDVELLWAKEDPAQLEQAISLAEDADITVLVLGLSQRLEGEEMPISIEGFEGGDRTNLKLPKKQRDLLQAVAGTGKPVVLVVMAGSAIALNKANATIPAILHAGYPGEQGGNAVADVLFGDYNPAGRLPATYYQGVDQLPAFDNYDMKGRTYRYFSGEPLYPFGYGLSYTRFQYSGLEMPDRIEAGDTLTLSVSVTNAGSRAGDEVVQLYLTDEKASTSRPVRQLEGFRRITLLPGETKDVVFNITPRQFSIIDSKGKRVIEPGWFNLSVGGKQPGFRGYRDPKFTGTIQKRVRVSGKLEIPF